LLVVTLAISFVVSELKLLIGQKSCIWDPPASNLMLSSEVNTYKCQIALLNLQLPTTRVSELPNSEDRISVDTIAACDGRIAVAKTALSIAACCKNEVNDTRCEGN